MRKLIRIGLVLIFINPSVFATPGPLDRFHCHGNKDDGTYHCHNVYNRHNKPHEQHTLLGIVSHTDIWTYHNGPENIFSGAGLHAEWGYQFISVYGAYRYQPNLLGNSSYRLTGFDIGINMAPNLTLEGIHPYVSTGVFATNFVLPNDHKEPLSGLFYGAGVMWKQQSLAIDGRALYRNTAQLETLWEHWGASGLKNHFSAQLGIYWRM